MKLDERLDEMMGIFRCTWEIWMWKYDGNFRYQGSDCADERMRTDLLGLLDIAPLVRGHLDSGGRLPLVVVNSFGLIWIFGFYWEEEALQRMIMIGPAFSGQSSHMVLMKRLDQFELSVAMRRTTMEQAEKVPVIPVTVLMQNATVVEYVLSGKRIGPADIRMISKEKPLSVRELEAASGGHQGVREAEQRLLELVRDGNTGYEEALRKASFVSEGVRSELQDPLRKSKNDVLVLLTLVSRAAMEGGLSPSVAYTMNDNYGAAIEQCRNVSDTMALSKELIRDYVRKVHEQKLRSGISSEIQSACDYITMHCREKLSIALLAEQAGYTDYYFSHRFRKETGESIREYIRRKRLEEAARLLASTNLSVGEISDSLQFGSRSYFFTCFRNAYGMSPTEYIRKNRRQY